MPAPCYQVWNANTSALTGPPTAVATSASSGTVKTMLQVGTASTTAIRVLAWGYSFDTPPANNVRVELVDTGTVAATVTAHVAGSIHKVNIPTGAASTVALSTTTTGYTASAEGTVTATRLIDYHYENGLYSGPVMWPLGREWEIPAGNLLRIRATPTSAAAVNITCWISWEE